MTTVASSVYLAAPEMPTSGSPRPLAPSSPRPCTRLVVALPLGSTKPAQPPSALSAVPAPAGRLDGSLVAPPTPPMLHQALPVRSKSPLTTEGLFLIAPGAPLRPPKEESVKVAPTQVGKFGILFLETKVLFHIEKRVIGDWSPRSVSWKYLLVPLQGLSQRQSTACATSAVNVLSWIETSDISTLRWSGSRLPHGISVKAFCSPKSTTSLLAISM